MTVESQWGLAKVLRYCRALNPAVSVCGFRWHILLDFIQNPWPLKMCPSKTGVKLLRGKDAENWSHATAMAMGVAPSSNFKTSRSKKEWEMKVYRKPLRRNVKILVVNSILKCHHGSQGTKTQQIGCHLSNLDGSTLTCRDHRVGNVPNKHATKTTPPNWSNKSTVFYLYLSCLNWLIQHDSRGSSQ